MKVEKLIEWLSEVPKDWDVVLSEYHVISGDNDLIIVDMPVVGLTQDKESNELRLMIEQPRNTDEFDKHIKSLLNSLEGNFVYEHASIEFSKEINSETGMPLYGDVTMRMLSK